MVGGEAAGPQILRGCNMENKKYLVQITETVITSVEVVATDRGRAVELAKQGEGILVSRGQGFDTAKILKETE